MRHQPIYAPVPMLAADVSCFWALEQDQESYNREVYLPDAYIEVIINVGAPLMLESEYGMLELPQAFVNPLQNKPLRIRAAGFCQMISMQLYPWAVKPILNIDADPSTVHVIGLDADWQRFADDLTQIVAHRGYEEAIDCYQEFVCKTAYRHKHDLMLTISCSSAPPDSYCMALMVKSAWQTLPHGATYRPANSSDSSNITRLFRLKRMHGLFALAASKPHCL
jgi:hypothetical protein